MMFMSIYTACCFVHGSATWQRHRRGRCGDAAALPFSEMRSAKIVAVLLHRTWRRSRVPGDGRRPSLEACAAARTRPRSALACALLGLLVLNKSCCAWMGLGEICQ